MPHCSLACSLWVPLWERLQVSNSKHTYIQCTCNPEEHGNQLAHTRWTPKPPSIHTLTHTKSFWQELHHHGNKTQKREALAQLVYSNHRESRKKGRVVQLDSRGLGGGEHGEWRSEGGGTREQDFMLKVLRKHETVFSFCVWIGSDRVGRIWNQRAAQLPNQCEKRGRTKTRRRMCSIVGTVVSTTGSVSLQSLKVKQAAEVGAPSWLYTICWLSKYIHVEKRTINLQNTDRYLQYYSGTGYWGHKQKASSVR